MAETAKPKPQSGTSQRKAAAKPAAPARKAAGDSAGAPSGDNGGHVKITPPEPGRKGGGAWFALLLLVIVGAGAGYLTWPRWQPHVAAYLPDGFALALEDPRVAGLSVRVGKLESETQSLRRKDQALARLEDERLRLSKSLAGVLERIESIEHSITAVKEMAKAAASAEEAAAAGHALKALNDRLSKVEAAPPGGAGAAPGFTSRLAKLERNRTIARDLAERIAQLEKSGAQSRKDLSDTLAGLNESRASLSKLEGRIAAVERRPAGGDGKSSVIVLAVSELRDAVHRGRAFANEFDAVRAAGGGDPAIQAALAALEKNAATGVATLSELRDAFAALAGEIAAAGQAASQADWFDRAVGRLSSLVRFRRIDGAGETESAETLVSQTEKHLDGGDLPAAARAVEKLGGAAKTAAAPWLARAKAHLAAEKSLADLHARAISMLSAPKG